MFSISTIFQRILADLPAIPDDVNQVKAEATEFITATNGAQKGEAALKFGQTAIDVLRQVMGKSAVTWPVD